MPALVETSERFTRLAPPASLTVRTDDERAVRRELRRQIARLESELSGYADLLVRPEPSHPLLRSKGHLAGTAELERTRDALVRRLAEVRVAARRRGEARESALGAVEAMVRDPAAHRWQLISSDDTGDPACKTWHSRPRFGLMGMLLGWWRVKVSSGCPLAAPREAAPDRRV